MAHNFAVTFLVLERTSVLDSPWVLVPLGAVAVIAVFWGLYAWYVEHRGPRGTVTGVRGVVEYDSTLSATAKRWAVRLQLHTEGDVGEVVAYLVGADGFNAPPTALPLGWSNRDATAIYLDSTVRESVFVGFADWFSESGAFLVLPVAPGFPERHIHTGIAARDCSMLLVVRLVQVESRRCWDAELRLLGTRGSLTCNAQLENRPRNPMIRFPDRFLTVAR